MRKYEKPELSVNFYKENTNIMLISGINQHEFREISYSDINF